MSLANATFVEDARHFCRWAEAGPHDIETARNLLLALMQGIPYLDLGTVPEVDQSEYPHRGYEGWQMDHKRFSDFPFQYYLNVFSPFDLDNERAGCGDAHDDLADIYGELWHGLQALDRGDEAYAVSYWRDSYFQHWGYHASAAIHAIDAFYRNMKIGG